MVNFDTREGIMKEWDRWVKYYKAGSGGTWPRDAFESLLDHFEERISQLSGESSGGDNIAAHLVEMFRNGGTVQDMMNYLNTRR